MVMKREQILARIIIRVRLGMATEEERELLRKWLDEEVANRRLYRNIIRGRSIAGRLKLEDEIVFEYLKSIYSTIVYRDVVSRYALRNTDFLERLLLFLADNVGSIFSAKGISDYLKSQRVTLGVNQILTYIDHFANAFIISCVDRYDIVGKRIFEVGNKYYFENLGIRNVITGFKLQDQGKILKNIVYNHLLYQGYKVSVGVLEKQEVDFIGEWEGEKVYVQVALQLNDETTVQREFGNLLKIEDNYPKIVVSQDLFHGNTYEGIQYLGIRDFLMKVR